MISTRISSNEPLPILSTDRQSTAHLLFAGLLAPAVFTPLAIAAGVVTPGYGHVASTFSDSAAQGAPHPEIIGAGLALLGVCLLLFSVGLARVLPSGQRLIQACLVLTAISIFGTASFQDHNRAWHIERNNEGYLHNAFALSAVLAILATIATTGFVLRGQPQWNQFTIRAVIVFIVAAVAALGFNFGPDSHDGLAERILALAALTWVAALAANGLSVIYAAPISRILFRPAGRSSAGHAIPAASED